MRVVRRGVHDGSTSVDVDGGVFRVVAVLRDFAAQEDRFFLFAEGQGPERAHAPLANHLSRDVGGALDIVAGAGGDVSEENFFGERPPIKMASVPSRYVLV